MAISAPLPENSVNRQQRFADRKSGRFRAAATTGNTLTSSVAASVTVRAVATGNITTAGTQTIDGVALTVNDRVLSVGQTTAVDRVIWLVKSGAWVRDDTVVYRQGMSVDVVEGSLYKRATYRLETAGTIVPGTTALAWGLIRGTVVDGGIGPTQLATAVAGAALTGGGGSPLDWNPDNTTLEVTSDAARVKDGGITDAKLSATGVAAGTYAIATVTVNAQGRITSITAGSGGGTVTGITAGNGLSGGTITTSGTIDLNVDGVTLEIISNAARVKDGGVGNAKLRNSSGLSVIGRSANNTGAPADITGTDGQVLRVSGTTLGFGTVATAGVADGAITTAKLGTEVVTGGGVGAGGKLAQSTVVPANVSKAGGTDGMAMICSSAWAASAVWGYPNATQLNYPTPAATLNNVNPFLTFTAQGSGGGISVTTTGTGDGFDGVSSSTGHAISGTTNSAAANGGAGVRGVCGNNATGAAIWCDGSFKMRRTAVNAAYNVLVSDLLIAITGASINFNITLPAANTFTGRILIVKDEVGALGGAPNRTVTLIGTIDGLINKGMNVARQVVRLYSDGTNWQTW